MNLSLGVDQSPRLKEALDRGDVWTGFSDAKARRKAQNRLNQRAARRRKDPEKLTHLRSKIQDVRHGHQRGESVIRSQPSNATSTTLATSPPHHPITDNVTHRHNVLSDNPLVPSTILETIFPLSSDHLITLVAHNVVRGFLTNMSLLQIPPIFACEMVLENFCRITPLPLPTEIPPSLAPTFLQQTIPHPPWIDIFPIATVRDTVIRSIGMFNGAELCDDTVGNMFKDGASMSKEFRESMSQEYHGLHGPDNNGLILWGDPWDEGSWEVTASFLDKWGWMFRDCAEEVLKITNYWRNMRSEGPLIWDGGVWKERSEANEKRIVEELSV